MTRSHRASLMTAFACAALFASWDLKAEIPKFTEDFLGLKYSDTSSTTAWWDVVEGMLRLYPYQPVIADTLDTPGWAMDAFVSGNLLYIADGGAGGLRIYDISDPGDLTLAGWYDTPGTAYGVALAGQYAFIADGSAGMTVVDISDSSSPFYAGGIDTPDQAYGIDVEGDHAYVAVDDDGLVVIDISDPSNPVAVDTCDTPGQAQDVDIAGDYAYVADFAVGGLQVVDISDPSSAVIVDSYNTPGTAYGVTVSGDYAYVADWQAGLVVIDISDPTDLSLAGSLDPGYVHDVEVVGDYVYAAGFTGGLHIIDVQDPASPTLMNSINTENAHAVTVDGEYAYLADYLAGIKSIRICEYSGLYPAGELAVAASDHIVVEGSLAFDADGDLLIIDLSHPESPALLAQYDVPGTARSVDVAGDYAFVGTAGSGLVVVDISNPSYPAPAGSYFHTATVRDVQVDGDNAYLALQSSGILVLDISDPATPLYEGEYDTPGSTTQLVVDGDYLYSAEGSNCVYALDISDPGSPVLVDNYSSCVNSIIDIAIAGKCLFAIDLHYSIRTISIEDPSSMSSIGGFFFPPVTTDYIFEGLAVSGDLLFSLNQYYGFMVFDAMDLGSLDAVDLMSNHFDPDMGCEIGPMALFGDYLLWGSDDHFGLVKVYERRFQQGEAQSKVFAHTQDQVACMRVTASQVDSIQWSVSADSSVHWMEVPERGVWTPLEYPGGDLSWKCSLYPVIRESGPECDLLEIEWLYEMASMDSIIDVPDDQGGWVRVFFSRSGYDIPGAAGTPISSYYLYRRIDDMLLRGRVLESGKRTDDDALVYDDRVFRVSMAASGEFPPGMWEVVGEAPALNMDQYVVLAPTTGDSAAVAKETVFCVVAVASPSDWYVSYPDSGYSVDNIAPGVPLGMAVAYNTGSGNQVTWDPSPEEDFQYYRIYRADSEDFVPGAGNLVHQTATESWSDPEYDGWDVYYKVTALDHAGNESDPASPESVTGDDPPSTPKAFMLYQNTPNPFNPATTIRFDLPSAVHARLCVYNVKGELVATLVDQHMTAGHKEIDWTARSDQGNTVASGIYFYRLVAGDFVQTRKMVLLR